MYFFSSLSLSTAPKQDAFGDLLSTAGMPVSVPNAVQTQAVEESADSKGIVCFIYYFN